MILATAHPNKRYRWYYSISDFVIHARTNNSHVRYYEVANDREKYLSEELVKAMFPDEILIKERPFLMKENQTFYAVLHRNKKEYQNVFAQLIGKQSKKRFRRTK